jgi:hypothetical protein
MISRYIVLVAGLLVATTAVAEAAQHRWHVVGTYVGTSCRGHPRGSTWTERDRRGRLMMHKCVASGDPLPGRRRHRR